MRHLPGCWALLHQPNWTRLWAERAKRRDFSEFYRETVPLSWKFGVGGVPCIFHSSVTHWPVVSRRRSKSLGHLQERWDDTGPQHCLMCVWPQLTMKLSKLLGFLLCFYGFSYVPTASLPIRPIRPINPFAASRYGPLIQEAHRAFPKNVEFVIPFQNERAKPKKIMPRRCQEINFTWSLLSFLRQSFQLTHSYIQLFWNPCNL